MLLAGVGGLLNAIAWRAVVSGLVQAPRLRRAPLVAPVGAVGLVGLVIAGAAAGFGAQAPHPSSAGPPQTRSASGGPVLVVAGFGTHWNGGAPPPNLGGYPTRYFSYRGLGPGDRPLPYTATDTDQSLRVLDSKLARQVESLGRGGAPVRIVAVSEGTLVAKTYLADKPSPRVNQLISVSPVIEPGRVYYPPEGDEGWGVASGWALGVFARGLGAVSSINITPSTPLFRSIVDQGPWLRTLLTRPVAGVRQTEILPLADAIAGPDKVDLPGETAVVTAFHNGSLSDRSIEALVYTLLRGGRVASGPTTLETLMREASAGWQVPTLESSVNPAWG